MTTPERVTYRDVREILRTFRDSGWAAMTLEMDGMRITVGKDGPPTAPARAVADVPTPARQVASATVPAVTHTPPTSTADSTNAADTAPGVDVPVPVPAASADTSGCIEITSPTVGAFWVAPSPGEPPFVQIGQKVEAGEQLAIVEVMKLMNPVVASQSGEIVQICAKNADLVEFDQVLFLIRPTDD